MQSLAKKAQQQVWATIITAIGAIAFLAIVFVITAPFSGEALADTAINTACWSTNTLKCGSSGQVSSLIGSACKFRSVESQDIEGLALQLRNTWAMYKQGECDFGAAGDEIYPTFAFTPEEDIHLGDLFLHLLSHNRGTAVEDTENSDYSYIQQGSDGQTLCFDKESAGISDLTLLADETYYIIYYDDQELVGQNYKDRILISDNPEFDQNYWSGIIEASVIGTLVGAGAVVVTVFTGGTATALYLGGAAGLAEIGTATTLTVALVGTKTAVIATSSAAAVGGAQGFIVSADTGDEEGCIVYGPQLAE